MVRLYRLMQTAKPLDPWFHLTKFDAPGGNEFAKLKHWDLLDGRALTPDEDTGEKKTSGCWRLSDRGVAFVRRELSVPKYAIVYNDCVEWFEGPMVLISECVKKNFNYDELWSGP